MTWQKKYWWYVGVLFVLAVSFTVWILVHQQPKLTFVACDVGQGDALLFSFPTGERVLVDGGPDRSVLDCLGRHLPVWRQKLDTVVLTHGDSDHLTGLIPVLGRYSVGEIVLTGVKIKSKTYEAWEQAVEKEAKNGAVVTYQKEGRVVRYGEAWIEYLYPDEDLSKSNVSTNESSVVMKVCYKMKCILTVGDTGIEEENVLLTKGFDLKADILKVGHHGSKYSSSERFLNAVKPLLAVVSVGKNQFGHPTFQTLWRLQKRKVNILRTDYKGDVVIEIDGEGFIYP
ncbi:MAG: MBL fold metallo-hydrolase [bacterium]